MRKFINKYTVTAAMLLVNASLFAQQTTAKDDGMNEYSKLAGAMVFMLVAFLFVLFFILSSPKYDYSLEKRKKGETWIAKLSMIFNKGVAIDKEKDIMMDDDFDGIRELNNSVPPWFNLLFYGTIVIGIIYMINYHVLGSGNVMVDEYVNEVKIANDKREELIRTGAMINENTVTLLTEAADLDKGKQIFVANCVQCHGPDGGGIVGPNLTDKNWIHGGGIKNVFKVITEGVPAKGMISWKASLNPKQIQQVGSYVLSLQGTTPTNPKAPEGDVWVETATDKQDSTKVKDTTKIKLDSVKVKTDSVKVKTEVKKDSVKVK